MRGSGCAHDLEAEIKVMLTVYVGECNCKMVESAKHNNLARGFTNLHLQFESRITVFCG